MNLSFQLPLYLVFVFIVVSFTVSHYLYRYTVPQVSTAKRMILVFLRGTALTFILLAICEPLFQLIFTENKRPSIALLVDNSLSMSQTDGAGNREKTVTSLLQSDAVEKLSGSVDLKMFSFSYSTTTLIPESLNINGGTTNISSAIQTSLKTIDDLRGIILVSDGNYNAGSNPLYDAEKSRIPLFTVGVGDTNEQKDISVSKLLANSIGYVDAAIPVDATIKASGISARTISVSLLEDGKKIAEQTAAIPASNGITEIPLQFSYISATDGVKKLSVAVSGVEGELTTKNNSRSALVKILKNKMNVVIIAGMVSPDVAAVMQALNSEKNINANLFYQLPNGEFKSQKENLEIQSSLTKADAVVTIGFPVSSTSSSFIQQFQQILSSRSLPVLFIAGRTLDLQKVRLLEKFFPFTVASDRIDEQMILPTVSEKYMFHQLLQNNGSMIEKLPPIFYSLPTFLAKPEAQQLLSVRIQNVPLTNPLFLIRTIGNIKSAAFAGYGLHRWKVLAGSSGETKNFFDQWFISLIRWLATREQDSFFRVEPSKEFYTQGEQIDFAAQVYNQSYQPVDNAEVFISIRSHKNNERYETTLSSIGTGLYEGIIETLSEGEFSYSAVALANGDTLGSTNGRISVGEQSIEFAETKMNKSLMKQLASASGGMYSDVDGFTSLVEKILSRKEMQMQEQTRTQEFELWNLPTFLTIIVLLFGVEWLLRKQSGML
ncbi:MAG: vWA domain-containing protein [Bacteroidota bacterium]